MDRILIWGGTGFIGRHLTAALVDAGSEVSVMTRGSAPAPMANVELIDAIPSRDGSKIRKIINRFDTIYNVSGSSGAAASNRSALKSLQDNCVEQLAFLEACADAGHRPHVIFASSRLVYGQPRSVPVDELHPAAPVSIYAAHKLCVEHYHQIFALKTRISYTVCRISNPFGYDPVMAGKSYGFINRMVEQAVDGKPITLYGDGSQLRDYVDVRDLVAALIQCGNNPAARNEVFNVGSGVGISLAEAAHKIARYTDVPVLFVPWPAEEAAIESGDYVSDIGKARRRLNYRPEHSFESGIRDIVNSYKTGNLTPSLVTAAGAGVTSRLGLMRSSEGK